MGLSSTTGAREHITGSTSGARDGGRDIPRRQPNGGSHDQLDQCSDLILTVSCLVHLLLTRPRLCGAFAQHRPLEARKLLPQRRFSCLGFGCQTL